MTAAQPLLALNAINVYYDKMHILHDVTLDVGRGDGEFIALLGRNGVGKTTTLRAISGLIPPRSGTIRFNNQDLQNVPADQISKRGISHVLQGLNVFPQLTVHENLRFNLNTDRDYQQRLETVFQYFPNLQARFTTAGQYTIGWRAPDVGHCARVACPTPPHSAG